MSDNYPSNSRPQPGQVPRQKQTAVTNVSVRKKPWANRVSERGSNIFKDVMLDVIVPMLRDLFAEAFHRGVDDTFYHDNPGQSHWRGPRGGSARSGGAPNMMAGYVTDYNAQYLPGAPQPQPAFNQVNKPFDFTIYTFPEYAAGMEVIDRLTHNITGYGRATVNDLYDLLNLEGTLDHTGENYGWQGLEAIQGAVIRRVRGNKGFYLDIPDAKPLPKK